MWLILLLAAGIVGLATDEQFGAQHELALAAVIVSGVLLLFALLAMRLALAAHNKARKEILSGLNRSTREIR